MWKNVIVLFVVVILMILDAPESGVAKGKSHDVTDSAGVSSIVSSKETAKQNQIPDHFEVRRNYPNPFNAATTIEYDLPEGAGVFAVVYDILGHRISTLKNELQDAGMHKLEWDGTTNNGNQVASGVYFYVLLADDNYSIGKMLLLK